MLVEQIEREDLHLPVVALLNRDRRCPIERHLADERPCVVGDPAHDVEPARSPGDTNRPGGSEINGKFVAQPGQQCRDGLLR